MRPAFALAALLLSACVATPDAPIVSNGLPAPAGSPVALGQPVTLAPGRMVATPVAVVEDSRCPQNARCVQAGRLVVSTRIDGIGWRETVPLTLGEPHATHGTIVTLVSGLPEVRSGVTTPGDAYRFAYQAQP